MPNQLQLLANEKVVFDCRPQGRLVWYLMLQKFALFFLILLVVSIGFLTQHTSGTTQAYPLATALFPGLTKLATAMFGVFIFVLLVFYLYFSICVARYWYVLTDQRFIQYYGFIGINQTIVPYDRIANVCSNQTTLDALLGLTSVRVDEKLAAFPRVTYIHGLSNEKARKIMAIISEHIARQ